MLVNYLPVGSQKATEMYANVITRYAAAFQDRDIRRRRLDALSAAQAAVRADAVVLDDLERRTFDFFWETTDARTGLARRDRGT